MPLWVRNHTGCGLVLRTRGEADTATFSLDSGEEQRIGYVGGLHVMELNLMAGAAAVSGPTLMEPIWVPMDCLAPGVRAIPTHWQGVDLWQEVLSTERGICCRLHSPVLLVNRTPVEVAFAFEDGRGPKDQSVPPGAVIGLREFTKGGLVKGGLAMIIL